MKKIISLVLALAMIMMVGAAFATAQDVYPFRTTDTVTVNVNGVMAGDVLYMYKLGTPQVDEHNVMTITWNPAAVENLMSEQDEAWNYAANAPLQTGIAALIAQGDISLATADFTSSAATGTTATVSVAPGYYLGIVRQGETSTSNMVIYQNMLISAIPEADSSTGTWVAHSTVNATVKKTTENLTKEQLPKGSTEYTPETVDGYRVGEYIPFKINTTIPNYPQNSKVATFEVADNPTGLRIVNDTTHPLVLKVASTDVTSNATSTVNTTAADETFKITVASGNMKIEFDKEYILAHPGQAVEVTYYAELLGTGNEIVIDTTHNTAKIKYNANPNETTYQEPDTDIDQKTFNFTLLKYKAGDTTKNPLVGASFSLWDAETNGNKIALKAVTNEAGDTVYRPIKEGETADDYIVATDGTATVVGLAKATYYLQEDIAPANFTPLAGRQAVSVNETTSTVGIDTEIPNTEGTTLPSTGGIGTTIFYILGGLLVVGAAVILVARRKAQD